MNSVVNNRAEFLSKLMLGDCLESMKEIPDKSVDLILCDLPYGTTVCKWDTVISFEALWSEYSRIAKPDGVVALFGTEPFASHLRLSNIKDYRYDWIWKKSRPSNFINCKIAPLQYTENISIFYRKGRYSPQMTVGKKNHSNKGLKTNAITGNNFIVETGNTSDQKYPSNIIEVPSIGPTKRQHPTEKPVPLLEYLIKTYTAEGDTVLDNTMGSGSTGVATKNTGRSFIGIEKDPGYFEIAKLRIDCA